MAAKKAPTKKMTLKKAPKARKIVVFPYHVRIGTRNELGPDHTYGTEKAARDAIITNLKEFKGWCERHNRKGLTAIDEAISKVSSLTFSQKTNRLECVFDEMYGLHVVAEYWKTS